MRISFHCKRYYTGKDVLADRFGRLYEFPYHLANQGHQVRAYCLDYYGSEAEELEVQVPGSGSLSWHSRPLGGALFPFRLGATAKWLHRNLSSFSPEVIIGASDIPNLGVARWLARKTGTPYVVDLYDNFESFGQAKLPGFRRVLRDAAHDANLVVAASPALAAKVCADYAPSGSVRVMSNGVNKQVFFPADRLEARKQLSLPPHAQLIGTAGSLSRMKGFNVVLDAWAKLSARNPDAFLVLAGPLEAGLSVLRAPQVIYLGKIAETDVSCLFRALDLGIVPIPDSQFGRYCFPQKLYEMLACGLPFVASSSGPMPELLKNHPELMFGPNDANSLVLAIERQLQSPTLPSIRVQTWDKLIRDIEPEIRAFA